ncbi:unnamed protein product [Symbiodinium sp. CCMP2592]|nr:unnamed protein product [Symbiodinium sp. CCMP2592]
MMRQCPVSGMVTFENGEVVLRLAPSGQAATTNTTPSASTSPTTSAPPWGIARDDNAILVAIGEKKIHVHPSRLPMSTDSRRVILNNVQRALNLDVGLFGQWNLDANTKLLKMLAKAKRLPKTSNDAKNLALEDKKNDNIEQLAVEDTKHDTKDTTKDESDHGPSEDMDVNDGKEREDTEKVDDSSDSSSECNNDSLAVPQCGMVKAEDLQEPITLHQFLQEACRRPNEAKVTTLLFDVHTNVPEFSGFARIGERRASGVILDNHRDVSMNVVKIFHFSEKIAINHALKLCSGDAFIPSVYRPGPWGVKKTVQFLLQCLPGYRILWNSVGEKPTNLRKAQSSQWAPEDEALRHGIDYINANAPEGDALNEQTFWILCSIREGSDTLIAGWPEAKVRDMCRNKVSGNGWPGVGKTRSLVVMTLAIARHHINKLGVEEKPSWRRAKSLDNFRHRAPQIHDGVFLDDPSRDRLDMTDLKSFMTTEEDQTCSGRYDDVKLSRGQVPAYAGNHLTFEDEPGPDDRTTITSEEILKMLGKTFPVEKDADVMAVLKRSIASVSGKSAVYLHLPSQHSDGIVHRIVAEDVHLDVLAPTISTFYPSTRLETSRSKAAYIEHCAKEGQQRISPIPTPARRVRHLPSSPSSPEANAIPPTVPFSVQLATPDQPRKRLLNSSTMPPPRSDTQADSALETSTTSAASPSGLLAVAPSSLPEDYVCNDNQDAGENAMAASGDEMDVAEDFQEDEEAARHLGLSE